MPAPPEAITGTSTALADGRGQLQVVAVARAVAVHAREQDLARAALDALACPGERRRGPSASRPPRTCTPASRRRLRLARRSRARRTARRTAPASSSISSGRASAAELTETLSAPASSTACASATERMPPPIVNGTKTSSARAARELDDRVALLVRRGDVEEARARRRRRGRRGRPARPGRRRRGCRRTATPLTTRPRVDVQARDHALVVHRPRNGALPVRELRAPRPP